MTLCHVKFSISTEINIEKCHTLMSFHRRPSVTLLCPTTQDQTSHSNVLQPMTKRHTVICFPPIIKMYYQKAPVFPEPVFAFATIFFPFNATGIPASWISVGSFHPRDAKFFYNTTLNPYTRFLGPSPSVFSEKKIRNRRW